MASSTIALRDTPIAYQQKINTKTPRLVSWAEFERRYLSREDGFKYEWDNGLIIKTKNIMRGKQWFIVINLLRFLRQLQNRNPQLGWLLEEADIFLNNGQHKRPDICYVTDEQAQLAANGEEVLPRFVIELISETDKAFDVQKKLSDYFEGGIEIVWQIYPSAKEVVIHRFDSDTALTVKGEKFCSAEPVIEGFLISADDIFKKTNA